MRKREMRKTWSGAAALEKAKPAWALFNVFI